MNISALQPSQIGIGTAGAILSDRQTANRMSGADSLNSVTGLENQPASAVRQTDLQDAVGKANDFVKPFNSALNFSVDQDSQTLVVKVVDQNTQEVIRQIPSEEMLALAKALDTMKGLLIQQKA